MRRLGKAWLFEKAPLFEKKRRLKKLDSLIEMGAVLSKRILTCIVL